MKWLNGLEFETIVVHLRDGTSIRGNRAAVYDDCMILVDPVHLDGELNTQTRMGGDVVIPRDSLVYFQRVTV